MIITKEFLEKIKKLDLPSGKPEKNDYVVLKMVGDGKKADPKFNLRVYQGKEGLKLDTNDLHTLNCLIEGKPTRPENLKRTISIDDSGVGFLLGGVLCGMHDTLTDEVITSEVHVKFFQGENRSKKKFVDEYGRLAVEMVEKLHVDKETTLIKICTGFVNDKAKIWLRKKGYFVEICEIKGKLQDELELMQKDYILDKFNYKYYIDPKESNPRELAIAFRKLVYWVKKHKMRRFCKDKWGMD